MLLDKNNIESSIVSYTLDGFSMTAKAWTYENKATIFVLDKDVKYNQDFYYVLKGGIPSAGESIESMKAEMFSNPFDAYAKFQDLLNEEDTQSPPPPPPPEDQKIPIVLKNKKTNECEIREVNGNLEVGNDVLGQAFIGGPNKVNMKSEDVMETQLFIEGESMEVILLKASRLDTDGKDAYFVIPKQPQPPEGPPPEGPQGPPPEGPEGPPQPPQGPPPEGPEGPPQPPQGPPPEGPEGPPQPPQGPPPEGPEGPPQPPQGPEGPPPEGPEGPPREGPEGPPQPVGKQPDGGESHGNRPDVPQEIQSDRVRIISEVSGIDQDIVKNNFRNVNLAVNFLSGINFKELQNRLNTDKTAYQLAQEVSQEIRNS